MASWQKYNCFVADVANKVHNLGSDTLKIALTNNAPNLSSHTTLSDITEISAGNGYSSGGMTVGIASSSQSGGTYKLVPSADPQITASGGSIGPFRYGVLYNATASGGPLIGMWDFGSSQTASAGNVIKVDLDGSNGIFSIT